MKERKIFTVTDLGPGDGGKGGIVHGISTFKKAHTIIKVGGAQGSHGVRTSKGQHFNFSHFGCATFEGAMTHVSPLMVIEPLGMMHEAELLKHQWGISEAFDMLTIDAEALCITPFHGIASHLREFARRDNPKGTVGIGGGECVSEARVYPELAIRAKDLGSPNIKHKLEAIRQLKLEMLSFIIEYIDDLLPADIELARHEVSILRNPDFVPEIARRYRNISKAFKIVDQSHMKGILEKDGVVVVESSHGVLTDRYYGFHPHTTKLRTIPQGTLDMLSEYKYSGDIIKLGVTRAYQIRHGAGPMVTANSELQEHLLPGSSKGENRWQGKVRVGALDLVMLNYAIGVCGGPQAFDALAISWFDQIKVNCKWELCPRYKEAAESPFFGPDGNIRIERGNDQAQLKRQKRLGEFLNQCSPEIISYDIPDLNSEGLGHFCAETLKEKLGVPVRMVSLGPTEEDKVFI